MAKKIQVELSVKDKGTPTVKKFSTKATNAFKMLAGPLAAGAVIAAFTKMGKHILELGDQLDKMSQRTGFTVEQLDKLRQSAALGGTSLQTVERAIRKLQKNMVDAARGVGLAKEAFNAMGISIKKLMALNPEEQFQAIAQEVLKIEDPTLRAARAQELLGISGTNLIPMLKDVANGLQGFNAQVTTDQAKNIAAFNDQIAQMKFSFEGLAAKSIGPVVEKLNAFFAVTQEFKRLETEIEIDKLTTALRRQKAALDDLGPAVKGESATETNWRNGVQFAVSALENEIAVLQRSIDLRDAAIVESRKEIDVIGKNTDETEDNTDSLEKNNKARQDAIDKLRAQVAATEAASKAIRKARAQELGLGDEEFAEFVTGFGLPDADEEDETSEFYNHQLEMQRKAIEDMLEADKIALEERTELYKSMALGMSTAIVNPLIEAALGAKDFKEAFRQMAISILKQLAAIALMKAIAGMFGPGGGGGGAMPHIPALADGGILKGGFRKFGFGGIADKPTLGLIGEGQFNEAVVPLPNGRSIPVDMQGDEAKTINNNFYVQALDSKSLVELMRRNPEAIIAPLTNQIELGNKGLRSNLKKAVA